MQLPKGELSRFTIRTSDRRVFRRCLRKWNFMSSLRMNLERAGTEQNINFWFGSAIHFAMEDYFGYNRFGDPRRAFKAYYESFKEDDRPVGAAEYYDVGIGMLTYFMQWYPKHNKTYEFETIWFDTEGNAVAPGTEGASPAVEKQFFLDLGIVTIVDVRTQQILREYDVDMENQDSCTWPKIRREQASPFNILVLSGQTPDEVLYYQEEAEGDWIEVSLVPIHYHGTVDRVVVDKYNRWWILDYKTAKGADTNKLDTDDQISAYLWAMEQILHHKLYGFIYLQLTKDIAKPPKRLKDGSLSVDKKQKTTYSLVRDALIDEFGSIQKAPMKYIDFLNLMAEKETPEGDRFIRWDMVQRSENQLCSTYNNIMGETRTMINPDLFIFPNPTRDCIWDCPLRDACLALDDNRTDEVEFIINSAYGPRPRGEDGKETEWRSKIKYPNEILPVAPDEFAFDLENMPDLVLPESCGFEDFDI